MVQTYLLSQFFILRFQILTVATPRSIKFNQHIFVYIIHYFIKILCYYYLENTKDSLVGKVSWRINSWVVFVSVPNPSQIWCVATENVTETQITFIDNLKCCHPSETNSFLCLSPVKICPGSYRKQVLPNASFLKIISKQQSSNYS